MFDKNLKKPVMYYPEPNQTCLFESWDLDLYIAMKCQNRTQTGPIYNLKSCSWAHSEPSNVGPEIDQETQTRSAEISHLIAVNRLTLIYKLSKQNFVYYLM